ncbi:MAG: glycogen debranching enzyme family protein [Phycisphaerales bacterium]|nr:glycogen debranching enzyme family protein [Phycisphaerales bacterium]
MQEATLHIAISAETCRDARAALKHEWLVTNGIGGYAMGTVAGGLTRRYHGLLIAALKPPLGRTLLLAKIDDVLETGGARRPLYTNIWSSGVETPNACDAIDGFELTDGVATWQFTMGGAHLTKRIWMEQGANTTYVQYELRRSAGPAVLSLRALVASRDHHHTSPHDERSFSVTTSGSTLAACAAGGESGVSIEVTGTAPGAAAWSADHSWYRDFDLPFEESVGYDHRDSHLCAGVCRVPLEPGRPVTLVCAAQPVADIDVGARSAARAARNHTESALGRRIDHAARRLREFDLANPAVPRPVPARIRQLVLAADQFIVARRTAQQPDGHTIIAGYPWFTDWGRDTMISLPGLTLNAGRAEIAREVLLTWARYVDRGMIPNRFPDAGDEPEYNTVDATLWYLWAIDQYFQATGDVETLRAIYPTMCDIVDWHQRGTRYQIRVCEDGLIHAGEPGVQLTWMDAKVGERVITPRIGKPVEINALWHDGLCNLARLSDRIGESKRANEFRERAARAKSGFSRFWNAERNCCFDVIDGPDGDDARIQANQIFAVSLANSPLSPEQQRSVVSAVERTLLTPVGLRTLDPAEPRYHGRYEGRVELRDEAYHQGTAWAWLLGPFALAHARVHRDRAGAAGFLEPMLEQLTQHCVGTLAEIFDGDAPHAPRGCVAQAWSVAETLRAWCGVMSMR